MSTEDNQIYVTMSASNMKGAFEEERHVEDMYMRKRSNAIEQRNEVGQGFWDCRFIQHGREEVRLSVPLEMFINPGMAS
jgi:hypothetical protein